MVLITMTILMYAGIMTLISSDKSGMTDYEKRQTLKKAHLLG